MLNWISENSSNRISMGGNTSLNLNDWISEDSSNRISVGVEIPH